MKINKKHKKSYNTTDELDLNKLSDELVKPKQLKNKDSVKRKRK